MPDILDRLAPALSAISDMPPPEPSPYAKPSKQGYITPLTSDEAAAFSAWVKKNNVPYDPSTTADYDMPGFWKALAAGDPKATQAVDPNDGKMHFTDYWKTPYHETFSRESQYALPDAPEWNDKDQLVDKDGNVIFDDRAPKKQKR